MVTVVPPGQTILLWITKKVSIENGYKSNRIGPNRPKPAHLSPEQPIGPEMDRWTMKDQEDQQDQPKPARPSTAQISPEMDRWTMEDQGRPVETRWYAA